LADVVREAQRVELALKAGLRAHGVDPPRLHDVPMCCWPNATVPAPHTAEMIAGEDFASCGATANWRSTGRRT
jgi:hypothetical protein